MSTFWKVPPKIKVYEALGAVGDQRVHSKGNTAKVYSSSGKKFYIVTFDPKSNAIMTNDNGSYWQGYLGYPAIAFLFLKGILKTDKALAQALAGIHWKDINTRFKNDFTKTEVYVLEKLAKTGWNKGNVETEVHGLLQQIEKLNLVHLGKKVKPPIEYSV